MGWWQNTPPGVRVDGATGLLWGDEIADIMDNAVDLIREVYEREWQREPTRAEFMAGLAFSLSRSARQAVEGP